MKYSSNVITKTVKGVDGEVRLYQARKMPALNVVKEGVKLFRAIAPAFGTAADSATALARAEDELLEYQGNTYGSMLMMLTANLTEDHVDDLLKKLMGSLMFGDNDIGSEDKLNEHFDKYSGDFFEVAHWLLLETFRNFLQESDMCRTLMNKVMSNISPKLKELVSKWQNEASEESNTQL